ncbi:MAG: hypothetical protein R3E79_42220 [Caldilineaceae bacterium]
MSFQHWVEEHAPKDEAAQRLTDAVDKKLFQWPAVGREKDDYVSAIEQSQVSAEGKTRLKADLDKVWVAWKKREAANAANSVLKRTSNRLSGAFQSIVENIGSILGGTIAVAIVASIIIALFGGNQQFLEKLAHTEFARGLITFLFAIGTIGLAFVLALSVLTHGNDEESEARFERGKEVLTIFIGILGTIIGFYFGSLTNPGESLGTVELIPPQISNATPAPGDQITITALAIGGNAPYKYSILYETYGEDGTPFSTPEQALLKNIEGEISKTGLIVWTVEVPEVDTDVKVGYRLLVTDGADHSIVSQGHEFWIKKVAS